MYVELRNASVKARKANLRCMIGRSNLCKSEGAECLQGLQNNEKYLLLFLSHSYIITFASVERQTQDIEIGV